MAISTKSRKVDSSKVVANLRLCVTAGQVIPNPKIASVLGPKGIQIPKFCDEVNRATKASGTPFSIGDTVTVVIEVYSDRSYSFVIKDSPVSFLLLQVAGLKKGSGTSGKSVVGSVSISDVKSIATRKIVDMNAFSVEAAMKVVTGVARSMGIEVVA